MRRKLLAATILGAALLLQATGAASEPAPARLPVTTPKAAYGFGIGDDYQLANYKQMAAYWATLASQSDRMKLVSIGKTTEGRDQLMAIVSTPQNLQNLDKYRAIAKRLSQAESLTDA